MKKNKNVSKGTKHPQPKMKARMSGVSKTAETGPEWKTILLSIPKTRMGDREQYLHQLGKSGEFHARTGRRVSIRERK